ncbi:MAG: glycosyltransferase family 4 protein [Bacteroidota bacterium]
MPYPPKDGGSIAMNSITEGLIKCGNQVTVLAINTPKLFISDSDIDSVYRKATHFQSVFIDTNVKPIPALLNLFTNQSYHIVRFDSKTFEQTLIKILQKQHFDIIQIESLLLSNYILVIRKYSEAKIILRSHNVEYSIWERLAKKTANPLRAWYLRLLAKRLKKYEIEMMNHYDGIACITKLDALSYQQLGCQPPIITIPFGINLSNYNVQKTSTQVASVFHLGAMDWMPNADAMKWFLNYVWPRVVDQHSAVKLYLAGRNMPTWLLQLSMPNVEVVGEVSDAHQFINSKSIMVVPLSSGGGMRVKIIEGMALAKIIISTTIGAEGIEYQSMRNIIIANTAKEFVEAIHTCLTDSTLSDSIANNARQLAETNYDNQKICERLSEFYSQLLNAKK